VLNDNPLMLAPGREAVLKMLDSVEFMAVVDSLQTDTANMASVVFPEVGQWAKEGTTVSADRRVLRLNQAHQARGDAQQGWRILSELGRRLAERMNPGELRVSYNHASEIMDEMAEVIPLFKDSKHRELDSGEQQAFEGYQPSGVARADVQAPAVARNGKFALTSSRGLYTSYEAAAGHSPDADRLHREDSVKMNPEDAAALGVADGDVVAMNAGSSAIQARVSITAAVQPKMLWVASYYDGGAVTALFEADSAVAFVEVARA
jgi:predicted molibdopterin-dependent oxidoreductase YjgC